MITEYDFTFCPHCATKFEKKSDHLLCPNCKLAFYINPKPTNAVILKNDNGEILLVERSRDPKKGYWDLPGGFINVNETAEDSVLREVKEELNIEVKNVRYLFSEYDTYEYAGINYHTLSFFYEADIVSLDPIKPADDVANYKFFSQDALPFDHFAFESMKKALERLYK